MNSNSQNQNIPDWCEISTETKTNKELSVLLEFSSHNYERETNWFLKFHDSALKEIGALISAEILIIMFLAGHDGLSSGAKLVFMAIVLFLGISSQFFAAVGTKKCYRSYSAAQEYAVLMNKIIYAMGLAGKVSISKDVSIKEQDAPVKNDGKLYTTRHYRDALRMDTTDKFLEYSTKRRGIADQQNSYFWSKITINSMGLIGLLISLVYSIVVYYQTH